MRRRHNRGNIIGYAAVAAGTAILLALILPSGFWWFAVGVGLIVFGLWLNSCCC